MNYPHYNTPKQVIQVSFSVKNSNKKNRAVPIREELVAITNDYKLAIVLGQLMYDCNLHPELTVYIDEERSNRSQEKQSDTHGWIYMPAAEMCDRTLMGVAPKTMRLWFHQLAAMGFIDVRKNTIDSYDQTHEYRINLVAIEVAIKNEGFDLVSPLDEPAEKLNEIQKPQLHSSNEQNVRSNKKLLKDFKTLYTKKKDIHYARARGLDPDREIRKKYQKEMQNGAYKRWSDSEIYAMSEFAERETKLVSEILFLRDETQTSGESWLVHHVVSGDLPLSCAQSLVRLLHIRSVAGAALSAAIERFIQLPAEICRNIVHPIRYLAEMIREEDTARLLNAM